MYYWAILRYHCAEGHKNKVSRFYQEDNEEAVLRRIQNDPITCYGDHFSALSPFKVAVSSEILPLTDSQFRELGKDLILGADHDGGIDL